MAGKIIIADRDLPYAQALTARIRQHCPTSTVLAVSDALTLSEHLSSSSEPISLIVSESHFPIDDLPNSVVQLIPLSLRRNPDDAAQLDLPVRMGSVLPIVKRLDRCSFLSANSGKPVKPLIDPMQNPQGDLLSDQCGSQSWNSSADGASLVTRSADAFSETQTVMPSSPAQLPLSQSPRIILFMTQTTRGRSPHYVDNRCQMLSQTGNRVFYLPLMPNYYCSQWTTPDSGFGLSDLILRIGSGGLTMHDLGAFSAIDPLGRIQFRPTDRADDLFHCRTEDIYKLCVLLRERVHSESGTLLAIETVGIPFQKIRPILALCDLIEVIVPEGSEYAADVLRREISDVLADLPSISKVNRVPERSAASLKENETVRERVLHGKA